MSLEWTDPPSTEPQSAMVLTSSEWNDLAAMLDHARECCPCVGYSQEDASRRGKLAARIISAARWDL